MDENKGGVSQPERVIIAHTIAVDERTTSNCNYAGNIMQINEAFVWYVDILENEKIKL